MELAMCASITAKTADECTQVHHRHVGRCRLGLHLLLGPALERDPTFGEENRRVPQPTEHENDNSSDENSEVIDRRIVLHWTSVW
jgi:hypothetical protein